MQQGDRRAFEEFIDRFGGKVNGLVRQHIGCASDAEDVTQEIFIELFRCIGQFRGEASLATYVYRVALNRCLRQSRKASAEYLPMEVQEALPSPDRSSDPEDSAVRSELADRVHAAVRDLSGVHQDVVMLHEIHGLTYSECAAVLEVPVGTVKSRLSNAFRRLRESLGGYVSGESGAPRPEPVREVR
jgi:RNA polymerase sigma-70 factor (ECF subfamily)